MTAASTASPHPAPAAVGATARAAPRPAGPPWQAVLAVVWVVSAAYLFAYLDHGWVPHDEGTLAHSAERVLQGEVPHRDFDDVYTGGLSYYNALAFRTLGVDLLSLRLAAFGVFLLWVPALFYVALRLASPLAAGAAVLLCTAWSVPNYVAPMPSWYNLFLATFGTAAVCRYVDTGHRRWLAAAGVLAGLSCLVKVVGLYFVAAVLLFLLYEEQERRAAAAGRAGARSPAYSVAVTAGLLAFVAVLWALVRRHAAVEELFHFLLPGTALASLLVWREWRGAGGDSLARARRLAALLAPFLLGLAVPLALFVGMYAFHSAVGALLDGVFVRPAERLSHAARRPVPLATAVAALPLLLLLGVVPARRVRAWGDSPLVVVGVGAVLGVVLLLSWHSLAQAIGWFTVAPLIPLVVLCGVWVLAAREGRAPAGRYLFLLLCVTTVNSLVQYPFSALVYFLYSAPLLALAVLGLMSVQGLRSMRGPLVVFGFLLAFAVLRTNRELVWKLMRTPPGDLPPVALETGRASIRVGKGDKATYESVVRLLRAHATGAYTFATPDCPEVYYLSGLRSPTRTLFEFFDPQAGRTERILAALDEHQVTAVVINRRPAFSGPAPAALVAALEARYPHSESAGNFVVRWR